MRNLILLLTLLTTNTVFAETYDGTISGASTLTQLQLISYYETESAVELDVIDIPSIIEAVDMDWVQVSRVKIHEQVYEMVIVLSGNTYHGGLFTPGTYDMVGYNSDGDLYMYSGTSKDGEWVEEENIEYLQD